MGDGVAGIVVQTGSDVDQLQAQSKSGGFKKGDWVFGFGFRSNEEKAHQEYALMPWYLLGKVPHNVDPKDAVTLPNNTVTAFNVISTDLKLEVPWPKPAGYTPKDKDAPILVWGAASSTGMFMVQVLHWLGYTNILCTASLQHDSTLKGLGARAVFDYRDSEVATKLVNAGKEARQAAGMATNGPAVPLIVDCIGSRDLSLMPLSKVAQSGTHVAVLLPVILRDSDPKSDELPEYSMDVASAVPWADGVIGEGVRTHFYLNNEMYKQKLQSEIIPELLSLGVLKPNPVRVVEGVTLLERAETALRLLRERAPRGERLVWRVSDLPEDTGL